MSNPVTVEEATRKALRAYGMQFICNKEAERWEKCGHEGEYTLRLRLSAKQWLNEARRWRRVAEGEGI